MNADDLDLKEKYTKQLEGFKNWAAFANENLTKTSRDTNTPEELAARIKEIYGLTKIFGENKEVYIEKQKLDESIKEPKIETTPQKRSMKYRM